MFAKKQPVDLPDLIKTVNKTAPSTEPLDRLSTAASVAAELREVGDVLLDHYVEEARKAGHSWSQIGGALGVTKQAAQQRFVPPGFDRFTDRARRVLVIAEQEAASFNHNFLGVEHIVLGLSLEGGGVAAKTLEALDIGGRQLRDWIDNTIGASKEPFTGSRTFTPRARKVVGDLAVREALALGHNYIGTEHLLLAVTAQPESAGAAAILSAGVSLEDVRAKVLELLAGYKPS